MYATAQLKCEKNYPNTLPTPSVSENIVLKGQRCFFYNTVDCPSAIQHKPVCSLDKSDYVAFKQSQSSATASVKCLEFAESVIFINVTLLQATEGSEKYFYVVQAKKLNSALCANY